MFRLLPRHIGDRLLPAAPLATRRRSGVSGGPALRPRAYALRSLGARRRRRPAERRSWLDRELTTGVLRVGSPPDRVRSHRGTLRTRRRPELFVSFPRPRGLRSPCIRFRSASTLTRCPREFPRRSHKPVRPNPDSAGSLRRTGEPRALQRLTTGNQGQITRYSDRFGLNPGGRRL